VTPQNEKGDQTFNALTKRGNLSVFCNNGVYAF